MRPDLRVKAHAQVRGVYLDVSISESILSWQYLPLLTGATQRASTLLNGGAACYNVYRCADGNFVSLGAIEPVFWKNFCEALNRPDWIERQYETMPQTNLLDEVADVIKSQALGHWRNLLDDIDCCFEALFEPEEIAHQPQFEYRESLTDAGPAYPAWIDGQAVRTPAEFEQIDANEPPRWLTAGPHQP